ncbi:hypothetical protein AXG93_3285s1000 [Marchantia polymorpha subsp. ruderalis]|uniref:Uncharacterized protein n=1 Tax=Marchantia polymorpha subsp. ruderalis TaxID=1480154 RepID=A0A176VH81_MARPO|nr:hypothetical protein AXG93_3285s1000 [Marchantia polymorpha subsp. ruderalis]
MTRLRLKSLRLKRLRPKRLRVNELRVKRLRDKCLRRWTPLAEAPSAQTQCERTEEGRKEEARVPSAHAPLVVADQTGGAGLSGAGSPTALDILAGSSAAAVAAEAMQSNSRESPGNSVATEILNLEDEEDELSSEEQDRESVQGTPNTALCKQVVHLLRRTHTKVKTSSLLASLDETIKDLKLKNEALRGHLALVRKLQKALNKMRDEKTAKAEKEFAK